MSSGNGPDGGSDRRQGGQGGQTGGQAGQPGQGAQPRGQPGGAPGAGASATDVLSQPAGQETLKYVVGLLAVLGAGVGLLGFIGGELLSDNPYARSAAQSSFLTLTYVGAPLLVSVVGARGMFDVGQDSTQNYLLGFVGGFAGHIVLVFVGGIFTALASDSFEFGDALVAGIVLAVGTGIVAVGATWVADSSRLPAA